MSGVVGENATLSRIVEVRRAWSHLRRGFLLRPALRDFGGQDGETGKPRPYMELLKMVGVRGLVPRCGILNVPNDALYLAKLHGDRIGNNDTSLTIRMDIDREADLPPNILGLPITHTHSEMEC